MRHGMLGLNLQGLTKLIDGRTGSSGLPECNSVVVVKLGAVGAPGERFIESQKGARCIPCL
jgi:hypothetical protein